MVLRNRAFTLIELLIVIAIIAILTVAFFAGRAESACESEGCGKGEIY